jgi:hypothetical protein
VLRGVQEHQEAGEVEIPFVLDGQRVLLGDGARGHGDDTVARGELCLQGSACRVRYVQAPLQDGFRSPFRHECQLASLVAQENRDHQSFVVERQHREPGVVGQRPPLANRGGRVPEGLIQRVPADAPPVRCGVFGAQQAPPQHVGRGDGVLGGDGAHVVDPAHGQGAGLVGEQHVDVAEIFNADQSFDQHLAAAHPA